MPAKNRKYISIWKMAHEWLEQVSDDYKSRGMSSASMTSLASQAILAIQKPDGDMPKLLDLPCKEEEEK